MNCIKDSSRCIVDKLIVFCIPYRDDFQHN
nr:MAG TPA: hypothetical protein [Crassvirales sp.]